MKVRRCVSCHEYKYIEDEGLCRDCHQDENKLYEYTYSDVHNRFSRGSDQNQISLGSIGSGKTVANKIEIYDTIKNSNVRVFIVDPIGNYRGMVTNLNGKIVSLDRHQHFNPFCIAQSYDNSGSINSISSLVVEQINRMYDKTPYSLGRNFKKKILHEQIKNTYNNTGITDNPKTHDKTPPTISDLVSTISSQNGSLNTVGNISTRTVKPIMDDIEDELTDIITKFKINDTIQIDYAGEDLVYMDLSKSQKNQIGTKMHMALNSVWQESRRTKDENLLYIDNSSFLFEDSRDSIESIHDYLRVSNNYNLSVNLSLIPKLDYVTSDRFKKILSGIPYVRLHRMDKEMLRKIHKPLTLTKSQISYLENADIGRTSDSSEVLVKQPINSPNSATSSDRETVFVDIDFLSKIS